MGGGGGWWYGWCPYQRGGGHVRTEAETGAMLLQAMDGPQTPRNWGRGMEHILPRSPQRGATRPTPWSWTSSLQNCETARFCCLGLHSLELKMLPAGRGPSPEAHDAWGREAEREGEKCQCARDTSIGCLLHTPNWGPGPQPRHVPWPGIKPMTFGFAGQHSVH